MLHIDNKLKLLSIEAMAIRNLFCGVLLEEIHIKNSAVNVSKIALSYLSERHHKI